MPTYDPFRRQTLARAILSLTTTLLFTPATAAEHAEEAHAAAPKPAPAAEAKVEPKAEAKPAPKPEAKVEAKAEAVEPKTVAKEAPVKEAPARDPMEVLREKLAARMNRAKTPPNEQVNVVAKADATLAARTLPPIPIPPRPYTIAPIPGRQLADARKEASAKPEAVHAHWSYEGSAGPDGWGEMNPEFAKCATGKRQSPIDIRDGIRVSLDPVQFDYKPSAFRVIDNGHTVQVNVAQGNSIEVLGRRYDLLQFHFHRPSEERIDGKQFDMVVHMVHKDIDGRLAVVAVLLERGTAQPIVQTVWNNLPLEKGEEVPAKPMLDLNALLPAQRGYFTYMGSLTTPPCSEGVLWMVMKNPVPVSTEQIAIFSRLYPMNARPIQAASGRLIKESN